MLAVRLSSFLTCVAATHSVHGCRCSDDPHGCHPVFHLKFISNVSGPDALPLSFLSPSTLSRTQPASWIRYGNKRGGWPDGTCYKTHTEAYWWKWRSAMVLPCRLFVHHCNFSFLPCFLHVMCAAEKLAMPCTCCARTHFRRVEKGCTFFCRQCSNWV